MNNYTNHAQYVLGFHGCDKTIVDKIINSDKEHLKESTNDYDWLGSGIYFWLNDPIRAKEWAQEKHKKNSEAVKEPAVIGAIIDLGRCLNFSERDCIETLKMGFGLFKKNSGLQIEKLRNKAPDEGGFNLLRPLDCAVINYTCNILKDEKNEIDTVMGIFQEGTVAFEGTDLREKTHTQICVRNSKCIMGYFLPRL